MTEWNYYKSEVAKTGDHELYRLKITSDSGESRWLTISRITRDHITDILASMEEGNE